MGKYMKKSKMAGEVAVMEVSPQSTLGVRTRARAMALQRLQDPSACSSGADSVSYIQLRSRRLEKASVPFSPPHPAVKESCKRDARPNPNLPAANPRGGVAGNGSLNSGSVGSAAPFNGRCDRAAWGSEEDSQPLAPWEPFLESDGGVEVSFGENFLELESRERSTRETTPCSLILSSDNIPTPGSTTRRTNTNTANRRTQSGVCWNMPTTLEMEEFFAGAEQIQQRIFLEKYNYDPAHDCPLPGRYEWIRIDA